MATKSIAFAFGRFNPPTIGHEKLMDNTRRANRNYRIYASQSQDAKKNPLNFRSKVSIMKAMFPVHARSISTDKVTTAIDVMVNLYKEKYTDVVMVAGSDRVDEFDKLLNAYNGKKARHGYYKFKSIRVISAGERDPDAEGVSGMSASKMRKAAQDNDYKSFKKGLPSKFRQGQMLFKTLQKAMGVKSLKEHMEESRMAGTGFAVAMKDRKGWKIVFKGNSRDQNKEIKKLQKDGKKLGKDFRGYRTQKPVGYIIREEVKIEEGRLNRVAKSLSDPKYRAKTEKDKKKEMKKGKVKHKGRVYEKIMTFKQAQEKDKKDQNKDPVGKCHEEDITNEGFFDMFFKKEMDASKKAIYKREYAAAAKMYQQFRKRGDSAGVALHKAASTHKHVSDRGLQQYLKT
tara:strand:+ start:1159 stop:2358 length:1200 start_codon:yes stop_codon:yes gene_type:complete